MLLTNRSPWLFIRMQMQWHALVTKDFLMRYKLVTLFLALILAPTVGALKSLVILPTNHLLIAHPSRWAFGLSLIGFQLFGLIWYAIQKALFSGAPWGSYFSSLPRKKSDEVLAELIILLILNTALWIPLLIAACTQPLQPLLVGKVLLFATLIVLTQLACKRNRFEFLIFAALVDLVLIASGTPDFIVYSLLVINAMLIKLCFDPLRSPIAPMMTQSTTRSVIKPFRPKRFALHSMQIKNTLYANPSHLLFPGILLLLILAVLIYSAQNSELTEHLALIKGDLTLIAALVVSGFYPKWQKQRAEYRDFLTPLPLSSHTIFMQDALLTQGILLIFELLTAPFVTTSWLATILMLTNAHLFLLGSYYPQTVYRHYGALLTGGLMLIFMCVNQFIIWTIL